MATATLGNFRRPRFGAVAAKRTTTDKQQAVKIANAWLCCHTTFILQCNILAFRKCRIKCEAAMSEDWNTKYGTRRVRRDPPTLDEAIFAAIGITDDIEAQAEIAASLMGMPIEEVLPEVKKVARSSARSATRVIAGEQGAQRSIVVERRVVRKFAIDKRTGT
jgi:hypothetical protein